MIRPALLATVILASGCAWADVYKCADGIITDQPCSGTPLKQHATSRNAPPLPALPTNWVKEAADRKAQAEKKERIDQCQRELEELQWRIEQVADYQPVNRVVAVHQIKQSQIMSLQVKIEAKKRECDGIRDGKKE